MQQPSFDPDVRDSMGWTPLMCAVSVRDGELMVERLLRRGAEINAKSK